MGKTVRRHFRLSPQENELLETRAKEKGYKNVSEYIRSVSLNADEDLKKQIKEIYNSVVKKSDKK